MKQHSNWNRFLTAIEYFFGSFFLGITSILVIEELGDWYSHTLNDPPLWKWWLSGLVTGAVIIGVFRFILNVAADTKGTKQ